MGYLEVRGGNPLRGEIEVQGSKNAVLPVLAGCLPGSGVCRIENCPRIGDVEDTLKLMKNLGCEISWEGNTVCVDASRVQNWRIEGKEAARIRSSILFLGALLGKIKKAELPLPGGCAIGCRPIDLHLSVLKSLGAGICADGHLTADCDQLKGCRISLPMPSVGATENCILAAVAADGVTELSGAAREPEIEALCCFLRSRGARIESADSENTIVIYGGRPLGPACWRAPQDRIVAGTYLLAARAAGGSVFLKGAQAGAHRALLEVLRQSGAEVSCAGEGIFLRAEGPIVPVPYLETAPYPGFPTDLQSLLMAVLCRAKGESVICERMFENRFRTAQELVRMGAQIRILENRARITGVQTLHGKKVKAPDLRGGAALVLAALCAKGTTRIYQAQYIQRGYEDIVRDLRLLGADIQNVKNTGG